MSLEFVMKKDEGLFGPDEKVKSRAIWNPSDAVKLYGGYINWRLIKALKKVEPEFFHGCSMTLMEHKLNKYMLKIPDSTMVFWDGANHDSS